MDKGEVFKHSFRVEPGLNGSFIVVTGSRYEPDHIGSALGFTTLHDLIVFLLAEADAVHQQKQAGEDKPVV